MTLLDTEQTTQDNVDIPNQYRDSALLLEWFVEGRAHGAEGIPLPKLSQEGDAFWRAYLDGHKAGAFQANHT